MQQNFIVIIIFITINYAIKNNDYNDNLFQILFFITRTIKAAAAQRKQ